MAMPHDRFDYRAGEAVIQAMQLRLKKLRLDDVNLAKKTFADAVNNIPEDLWASEEMPDRKESVLKRGLNAIEEASKLPFSVEMELGVWPYQPDWDTWRGMTYGLCVWLYKIIGPEDIGKTLTMVLIDEVAESMLGIEKKLREEGVTEEMLEREKRGTWSYSRATQSE